MNKGLKFLDYIFVLRPTLFFPVWTIALAGVWAQNRFDILSASQPARLVVIADFDISVFVYLGLFTLLMGAVFLVNQIEDVETDRLNKKLFLIANGDIKLVNAYIETILLTVLPIGILAFVYWPLAVVMILAYIIMGWMYSCKPLVMKNKPIGGFLPNFFGGFIVFSFGWMIQGQPQWNMIYYGAPYILGMMAVYFYTTIPDIEGDKASEKITVAVKYGAKAAIWGGLISDVIAIVFGLLTRDIIVLIPTLLILPFFIFTTLNQSVKHILTTNKFAALFLSLVICYRFPLYLVLIVFVFYFSKWYYKKRFNIVYPSLSMK